ncbi:MAG: S1 family peptidase [Pseudobdellovibrionaceae bacterium]
MVSKKALLLVVVILAACSPKKLGLSVLVKDSQTAIIGGEKASAADPVTGSTVSLISNYQGTPYSFCSGTLISKDLVVTAAHCLEYVDSLSIYFGEALPKKMEGAKLVEVSKWVLHPAYKVTEDSKDSSGTTINDVAVIKLASAIPSNAKPVAILDPSKSIGAGDTLLLAGYGVINEIGKLERADGLNFVRVVVAKLTDSIIVTDQTNAKGACFGDSGGPAYLETSQGLVLVGATRGSHDGANDCRHYGEYTNVTMFKSFLLDQAQQLGAESPVFASERYQK